MRLVNILLTNIAASRSPWRRCASMSAAAPPVTIDMVEAAAARISGAVDVTPVLTSAALDAATGHRLFFKCENLQRTGSFKARGAANAVFALDDATAARGVVCHSSGNHGAAVAAAARDVYAQYTYDWNMAQSKTNPPVQVSGRRFRRSSPRPI